MYIYFSSLDTTVLNSEYSAALTINSQMYARLDNSQTPNYYYYYYYYYQTYDQLDDYYYQAMELNVFISGYYSIVSNSNMDTYGYIYNTAFSPTYPNVDLITSDDNCGGNNQFKLGLYLQIMTRYILIITTSGKNTTGSFTIIATGPGSVDFSLINIASKTSIILN